MISNLMLVFIKLQYGTNTWLQMYIHNFYNTSVILNQKIVSKV